MQVGFFFHFLISDLFVYLELQSTYLRENHMYAVLFQFSIIIRSREARLHTILFVKCPNSLNCTLRFDEKICLLRPSFVTSFHIFIVKSARLHTIFLVINNSLNCTLRFDEKICLLRNCCVHLSSRVFTFFSSNRKVPLVFAALPSSG